MFCSKCGAYIDDNVKFCPNCGNVIGSGSPNVNSPGSPDINGSGNPNVNSSGSPNVNGSYSSNVNGETVNNWNHDYNTENYGKMSIKATSVVAYMTWIGFLVSYFAGDREGAKFYMNQALVFHVFRMFCLIPFVGWLWAIFILICFILGVIWAADQVPNELPLIGRIRLIQ